MALASISMNGLWMQGLSLDIAPPSANMQIQQATSRQIMGVPHNVSLPALTQLAGAIPDLQRSSLRNSFSSFSGANSLVRSAGTALVPENIKQLNFDRTMRWRSFLTFIQGRTEWWRFPSNACLYMCGWSLDQAHLCVKDASRWHPFSVNFMDKTDEIELSTVCCGCHDSHWDGLCFQAGGDGQGGGLDQPRKSQPVFLPGQGPMYAHHDNFGQVAWSRVPPTGGAFERQPFYHNPMVCEEAAPQCPPTPPAGIVRSVSFADRQVSISHSDVASYSNLWETLLERRDIRCLNTRVKMKA